MRCSHCNTRLTRKNKFCPECGVEVAWEEQFTVKMKVKDFCALIVIGILFFVATIAVGVVIAFGGVDVIRHAFNGEVSTPVFESLRSNGVSDIENVKDSVVMVELYDSNNNLYGTGSGFCAYQENWIVTNFHVIEGAKSISIITDDHKKYPVEDVIFFNREQDIAVLSFSGNLKALKLGDSKDIKIKDKITTIGSPKGELNTVSEGIISNVDEKNQIRITAPISHGSSGGVLLNDKNEVIGITSAGYDDAQNLNFATKIELLEELCSKYESDETVSITASSLPNYIGNIDYFHKYMVSKNKCYTVSSMTVFYKLTDSRTRFEMLLESEDDLWFDIYNSLDKSDKESVVSVFAELSKYEFADSDIDGSIESWDAADFFMRLGVLGRYQYAIAIIDIENYVDKDAMFDHVDENYPLGAAEKVLILYLLGGYDWDKIHTDNKEDIFDYFDAKYGIDDFGAILEVLGYEVVYESDGTLTAYW